MQKNTSIAIVNSHTKETCVGLKMLWEQASKQGTYITLEEFSFVLYSLQSLSEPSTICMANINDQKLVEALTKYVLERGHMVVIISNSTNIPQSLSSATENVIILDAFDESENYDALIIDTLEEPMALNFVKANGFLFCLSNGVDNGDIQTRLFEHSYTSIGQFLNITHARAPIETNALIMTLWIIIPVHNRIELTLQCLQSISGQSIGRLIKTLIIDDGSADGSAKVITEQYPNVEIISGDGDLWWTGAVAMGIDHLRSRFEAGDFFVLMNNDAFLQEGTLEALLKEAVKDRSVAWSPLAVENGNAIACGEAGHTLYHMNLMVPSIHQGQLKVPVSSQFGRCTLYPVEILQSVDNFDPDYFPQYWGDTDFGLRASHFGYKFMVSAKTCITVIQNEDTTGLQYGYYDTPQSLSAVYACLTEKRSFYNPLYLWRQLKRHQPKGRHIIIIKHVLKIVAQYKYIQILFNR